MMEGMLVAIISGLVAVSASYSDFRRMDSYRTNNNVPSVGDPYPTNEDHFPGFEDRLPLHGSSRGTRLREHDLNSPPSSVGYQGRVSNSKKSADYQGKITSSKKSAGYSGKLENSKNSIGYPGVIDNAKSGIGFPAGPIDSQFVGSPNRGFPAGQIDSQFIGSPNPGFPEGPIDPQFVGSPNPGFPADPIDPRFVGSPNPDTWGPIVIGDPIDEGIHPSDIADIGLGPAEHNGIVPNTDTGIQGPDLSDIASSIIRNQPIVRSSSVMDIQRSEAERAMGGADRPMVGPLENGPLVNMDELLHIPVLPSVSGPDMAQVQEILPGRPDSMRMIDRRNNDNLSQRRLGCGDHPFASGPCRRNHRDHQRDIPMPIDPVPAVRPKKNRSYNTMLRNYGGK